MSMSIFEIYIKDRIEYQILANGNSKYNAKLSQEIKGFLKQYNKKIKQIELDRAVPFLIGEWINYSKSGILDKEEAGI